MNRLIFCDTETSGLDENREHILELALVAVELPTFEVVARASWVVAPPLWPTVKRNMHPKAAELHEKNRLRLEVDCTSLTLPKVELEACAFVREWAPHTPAWHTPLAGAGPDFDRRFLKKHAPKLAGCFHYRNYDVRSVTQLQEWVFGVPFEESPHRALADCLKAVSDVRAFLGLGPIAGS